MLAKDGLLRIKATRQALETALTSQDAKPTWLSWLRGHLLKTPEPNPVLSAREIKKSLHDLRGKKQLIDNNEKAKKMIDQLDNLDF